MCVDTYRKKLRHRIDARWFAKCFDAIHNVGMKPQQLAALLNVAPVTLRIWSRETFKDFLSPSAQGDNGAHRSYDSTDARILAWVAELKAKNTPVDQITAMLTAARLKNWIDLPPLPGGMANDEPIAVIPREAAQERFIAIEDRYKTQLDIVVKERDELRTRLENTQLEMRNQLESARSENREIQKRLMELSVREAELRGKLEQYTMGGRQLNAVVIAVAALILGVVLTLAIVAISRLSN